MPCQKNIIAENKNANNAIKEELYYFLFPNIPKPITDIMMTIKHEILTKQLKFPTFKKLGD